MKALYFHSTWSLVSSYIANELAGFLQEPDAIRDYSLTFSLVMSPEEGGIPGTGNSSAPRQHLLVPGGDEIEVDSEKIYEFVKRYAEFRMLEVVKEPLEVNCDF